MAVHAPHIAECWRAIIAGWRSSGLSVTEFCRSRQICKSGFHRWRSILELNFPTSCGQGMPFS